MLISSLEIVNQIKMLLNTIREIPLDMESILAIFGFIAGIVVAAWQGGLSFLTIVSSYNIELSFMTKKERIKYNIANHIMLVVVLWFINLLYGFFFGFLDEDAAVVSIGVLLMLVLMVILSLITAWWLIGKFFKKLVKVHLCRFFGKIFTKLFSKFIKKINAGFRKGCGKLRRKIIDDGHLNAIGNMIRGIYERINNLWKSCAVDRTNVEKREYPKEYIVRATGFVLTTIIGILFNCLFALYAKDAYNVFVGGTLVTILTMEISYLYLGYNINPKDARIYYYDDEWQKNVFIYFSQDEGHCVGGDTDIMGEYNEWYLVPYERIEKQKLFSISKWKSDRVNIDNKRIRLQHGQNELMMNEVIEKIKIGLQSKAVVLELIEKADIYIKPEESKAYYVLSDGTKGDIDL